MPVQDSVPLLFQRYYNELYTKGKRIYNKTTKTFEYKEVTSNKIFDINKTLRAFLHIALRNIIY